MVKSFYITESCDCIENALKRTRFLYEDILIYNSWGSGDDIDFENYKDCKPFNFYEVYFFAKNCGARLIEIDKETKKEKYIKLI